MSTKQILVFRKSDATKMDVFKKRIIADLGDDADKHTLLFLEGDEDISVLNVTDNTTGYLGNVNKPLNS
jgi:hypothetical protein